MKKWNELSKEEKKERIIHIGLIAAGTLGTVAAIKSMNRNKRTNEILVTATNDHNKVDTSVRDPRMIFDNQVMTMAIADFRPTPGDTVKSSILPGFSYVLVDNYNAQEIGKEFKSVTNDLTRTNMHIEQPDADNVYDYIGLLMDSGSAVDQFLDHLPGIEFKHYPTV